MRLVEFFSILHEGHDLVRFWYHLETGKMVELDEDDPHHIQDVRDHPEHYGINPVGTPFEKYRAMTQSGAEQYDIDDQTLTDPNLYRYMLENGWVRGGVDKDGDAQINRADLQTAQKMLNVLLDMYPNLNAVFIDAERIPFTGPGGTHLSLRGDRMRFFARTGRVPTEMVQEGMGAGSLDSPKFRKWFAESKVVDRSDQPLLVYHLSDRPGRFNEFRAGTHFGTAASTRRRFLDKLGSEGYPTVKDYRGERRRRFPKYATHHGYLRIKNPIVLWDDGFDPLISYKSITWLFEHDLIDERLFNDMTRTRKRSGLSGEVSHASYSKYISALRRNGIDGVRYRNTKENVGSTSWIIFRPDQFWRVFQDQPGVV